MRCLTRRRRRRWPPSPRTTRFSRTRKCVRRSGAHRDAARASSRGHASGGDAVVRFGRDAEGFGARDVFAEPDSKTDSPPLALAAAAALTEVSSWAANAAAASSNPKRWASRVLAWATTSLRAGGDPLVAAVASREGGGGAAALAATLGALRDASSAPAAAAAAPALARAGAALLGAVAARPGPDAVAAGDAPAWAATRRAAYRELRRAGGALDELLEVCFLGEAAPTPALARAARSPPSSPARCSAARSRAFRRWRSPGTSRTPRRALPTAARSGSGSSGSGCRVATGPRRTRNTPAPAAKRTKTRGASKTRSPTPACARRRRRRRRRRLRRGARPEQEEAGGSVSVQKVKNQKGARKERSRLVDVARRGALARIIAISSLDRRAFRVW